jgi:hypothetical protein
MMRVDAADRAEVMLRSLRVETVGRELVFPLDDLEATVCRSHRHGPPHAADAASASPC